MERGGQVEEIRLRDDVRLDDITGRVDAELARAGAAKRIFMLETQGDWFAFLIVSPEAVAGLRKAKVRGIG